MSRTVANKGVNFKTQKGRLAGRAFENLLQFQAARDGLWLVHQGTQIRYLVGGKMMAVKSDLDFRLCAKNGAMAFFDAKSYDAHYFTLSKIPMHQLAHIERYRIHGVRSGLVVLLKKTGRVWYFDAKCIAGQQKGKRFDDAVGVCLGPESCFKLGMLLV